jgi:uncharacterized membrane protein SirB2
VTTYRLLASAPAHADNPTMEYSILRAVHISCAGIGVSLFAARGAMQMSGIDWRRWRWLRVAPHVNDTLLLAAAIAMAVMSAQYPLVQPWLTAKVLALCCYVLLGRIALRPGASQLRSRVAFVAALTSVGYIVSVAVTRSACIALCMQ